MNNDSKLLIIEENAERAEEVNKLIAKFEKDVMCAACCIKTWGKQ